MIAVDANILVYAHRADSEWHPAAFAAVKKLAESPSPWAIPWPCLHEFFSIATHPKIYNPPSTPEQALRQVDLWLKSPSVRLIGESMDHWARLSQLVLAAKISGPRVHDVRVAAICVGHGVKEIWSADRDFRRIPGLKVANPLISKRNA